MHFFMRNEDGPYDVPAPPETLPCVYLIYNHQWNDYGYRTNFHVHYFDKEGNHHALGDMKILQQGMSSTRLPEAFQKLDDQFCSLGESLEFYKNWLELDADVAKEVFAALRDVVAEPRCADPFAGTKGFESSLLRFSEARKAYKEGGRFFGRRVPPAEDGFDFTFTCQLNGFSTQHEVLLQFTKKGELPHRVVTFVGKNGTGKTGTLSKLAGALSGWDLKAGNFSPEPPQFSRVVAISYSVFQPFDVPFRDTTSYRYCGLRNGEGKIDIPALDDRTVKRLLMVVGQGRADMWMDLMRLEDVFGDALSEDFIANSETFRNALRTLSSGQRIIVSIVTDILQNIDEQSLILFDEPEAYLHPTLISTLMRLLHKLLEQHDSYAVVATHSPIVVQEMPSRSVRVFDRQGPIPMQEELPIESFGENLTEIVDHVFSMNEDDKNYKAILEEIALSHTLDEVLSLFDERLGLNARMTLAALYKGRKQ